MSLPLRIHIRANGQKTGTALKLGTSIKTMDDLLKAAANKLEIPDMNARKVFLSNGSKIDELDDIRDEDVMFFCKEEDDFNDPDERRTGEGEFITEKQFDELVKKVSSLEIKVHELTIMIIQSTKLQSNSDR